MLFLIILYNWELLFIFSFEISHYFQDLKQLHYLTASPSSETMTDARVKEVRGIKE